MTMVVIVIVEIAFAGDVLIPVIAAPLALPLTPVLLHPVMLAVTDILEGTVWRPHRLAGFEEICWRAWLLLRVLVANRAAPHDLRCRYCLGAMARAIRHFLYLPDLQHQAKSLHVAALIVLGNIAFGLVTGWLWVRTELQVRQ